MRRLISAQPQRRFQDNVIVVILIAALFAWLWKSRGLGPAGDSGEAEH